MTAFVLVHGAGTGAWLWGTLAEVLRERGHVVLAPTLLGVGERIVEGGPDTNLSDHIGEVAGLLEAEDVAQAVLVGFSYGGLVAGGVAQRVPQRIAALVYLDAFIPVDRVALFDVMPSEIRTGLESAAQSAGGGWQMPPIPLERLGGLGAPGVGVNLDEVRAQLGRRGPHPIGTYREKASVRNPASQAIPAAYIACTDHLAGDPMVIVADRVKAAGIPVHELDTGHFPMLTMPVELADMLETIIAVLLG